MRRYEKVSGTVFTVMAIAQLARAILGLPAQVGTTSIPIWISIVAFLVAGGLAIWGFRSSRSVA